VSVVRFRPRPPEFKAPLFVASGAFFLALCTCLALTVRRGPAAGNPALHSPPVFAVALRLFVTGAGVGARRVPIQSGLGSALDEQAFALVQEIDRQLHNRTDRGDRETGRAKPLTKCSQVATTLRGRHSNEVD
jgi:hypothetical protein